jgi:SAM-dependent methyltransferase
MAIRGGMEIMPYPCHVNKWLEEMGCTELLDLGCGRGEMHIRLICAKKTGIEIYPPYIELARDRGVNVIKANIPTYLMEQPSKSVEVIAGFDILEHFPKPTAYEVIEHAERVARRLVIWGGPLEKRLPIYDDPFAIPTQQHKSLWTKQDFVDLGYEIMIFENFHSNKFGPFDAMLCRKVLGGHSTR